MNFYEILDFECKKNGITITELLKLLGMSSGNTGSWKKGGHPSIDKLLEIANYLNVSVDYLLGREQTFDSDVTFDDFTYALYNETKELSWEQKEALLNMAKVLKKSSEK